VSGGVLERLSVRTPLVAADSLSGAELERARLDGRPVVVKHLRLGDDWVAPAHRMPPPRPGGREVEMAT
jgi:hypothetical protein